MSEWVEVRAEKLRPKLEKLRAEVTEAERQASHHRTERRKLNREAGEFRRELAALEHRGPDAPKRQSPLLPRPNTCTGA